MNGRVKHSRAHTRTATLADIQSRVQCPQRARTLAHSSAFASIASVRLAPLVTVRHKSIVKRVNDRECNHVIFGGLFNAFVHNNNNNDSEIDNARLPNARAPSHTNRPFQSIKFTRKKSIREHEENASRRPLRIAKLVCCQYYTCTRAYISTYTRTRTSNTQAERRWRPVSP